MDFDALRAAVVPGAAIVGRWPGLVCVAECSDRQVLRKLLDVCASAAGTAPGRGLARRLAMWLGGPEQPGEALRFGTVAVTGADSRSGALGSEQWAVFLYGAVGMVVPDRQLALSGAQSVAWTDRLLPRPDAPVVLALEGGPIPPGLVDGVHDLRAGVVPGAGMVLVPGNDGPTGDRADDERGRADAPWGDSFVHERSRWTTAEAGISVPADGLPAGDANGTAPREPSGLDGFDAGSGDAADSADHSVTRWSHVSPGRAHLRPVPSGTNGVTHRGRASRRSTGFDFGRFADTGRRGTGTDDSGGDGSPAETGDRSDQHDADGTRHDPDPPNGLSDIGADRPHQEANGQHVNGTGVSAPERHDAEARELDRSPWADDRRDEPPWKTDGQWFAATGEEVGTETDLDVVEPADARRPRHGRRDDRVAAENEDGVTADTETEADGEEVHTETVEGQGTAAADGALATSTALAVITPGGDLDDSAGTPRLGLPVGAEARSDGPDETGSAPPATTALRVERIHSAGPGEQEHRQREDAAPTSALALDEQQEAPQAREHLCARGHLNDPKAQICAFCGVRMDEPKGPPTSGPRPPLGMLVFDDGATYTVDAEYLVGRMPEADARVTSGALRGLALDDPSGAVSRVHVEVLVNGWEALLVDAGSRNGTYVLQPGEQAWTQLVAGEGHRLVPGTRIRIGGRSFMFESLSGQR